MVWSLSRGLTRKPTNTTSISPPKNGLQYIVLDEGWYKLGNVLEVVPEINMDELTAYARQKNVGVILWVTSKSLDDQLIPALDQYQKWGIAGVKVDFMQRSDQLMVNYFHKVSSETLNANARRFPRSAETDHHDAHLAQHAEWRRSSWHGVEQVEPGRGAEAQRHASISRECSLGLWTTRQAPCATPRKQRSRRFSSNRWRLVPVVTNWPCTWVFESPLEMLSDSPSNYMREPEAMEFLAPIPTVWDDTRVLDGKISDYVVVARRNGNDWYIGAMNDWTARELEIDLSFLPAGTFSMLSYEDGCECRPQRARLQASEKPGDWRNEIEDQTGARRRLGSAHPPIGVGPNGRVHELTHELNACFLRSTIVVALGGMLFGFNTVAISGTVRATSRNWPATLNNANQDHDNCQDQEHMDETSDGVRRNHAE